jgi:peptidoglycan/LPS O-acetylase OafA/YrhL
VPEAAGKLKTKDTSRKFLFVDALRGYAILGVIVVHAGQHVTGLPDWLARLSAEGARGVQLFFVVSAFTLFYSMTYGHPNEKRPLLNFFIRRFFRIAPAFYLAIIAYLLSGGLGPRYWLGDVQRVTAGNIASTFFFVNGWNPYWINSIVPGGWSVAVEMPFYATLPLLFASIKNQRQAIMLTVALVGSAYVINGIMSSHPLITHGGLWQNFLFFWFPNQAPVFGLGIVLFYLLRNNLQGAAGLNEQSKAKQSNYLLVLR